MLAFGAISTGSHISLHYTIPSFRIRIVIFPGYRYTLNLVKETDRASTIDTERVTAFLKSFCETIRLQVDSRTELKYKLVDSSRLPKLLTTLNEEKSRYGILDFGISLISLEDVYLRCVTVDLKYLSLIHISEPTRPY